MAGREAGYRMAGREAGYRMAGREDGYRMAGSEAGYRMAGSEAGYRMAGSEAGYRMAGSRQATGWQAGRLALARPTLPAPLIGSKSALPVFWQELSARQWVSQSVPC